MVTITIGVLTPHAAAGADVELDEMLGSLVRTRVGRLSSSPEDAVPPTSPGALRALTSPAVLDEAAARLEPDTLDAIVYASTSSAYVIGHDAERTLVRRLRHRWAVPVCSTPASAVDALRGSGVQRLALVHPPWFGDDHNARGAAYFREQGFTVVQADVADLGGLAEDPGSVDPGQVVDWVVHHVDTAVDAVFLGGNGFRVARAVQELEQRLGCLVVESNQVLLWAVLSETGPAPAVEGFGRLLSQDARIDIHE